MEETAFNWKTRPPGGNGERGRDDTVSDTDSGKGGSIIKERNSGQTLVNEVEHDYIGTLVLNPLTKMRSQPESYAVVSV